MLNKQSIIASDIKGTINYFKTFGNAITIRYDHLKELCANTNANLSKILEGEYSLGIVRSSSDKTALFHLCSSEEMARIKTTQLISKQIKHVLKSVEDIEGKKYYLVVLGIKCL